MRPQAPISHFQFLQRDGKMPLEDAVEGLWLSTELSFGDAIVLESLPDDVVGKRQVVDELLKAGVVGQLTES